jgi:sugar phosphate isomerase/epimerase
MNVRMRALFLFLLSALGCTSQLDIYDRQNLTAWCIVPFDAQHRGPIARAELLHRLRIPRLAYDWRDEHIPTFDAELDALSQEGIELRAFWFPSSLDATALHILDVLRRHDAKTELWVTMSGGGIECAPSECEQRIRDHVTALRPIVDAAAAQGLAVGLYNHGDWFGEPENQIEILKRLGAPNVGLVYNFHHGHGHLDRFAELLPKMLPYLYSINLNGMTRDGDVRGAQILPLGLGELDLMLLRAIAESGYKGPIGILGHTTADAEATLQDNLDGLDWLVARLRGEDPGPRPALRVAPPQLF